MTAPNFIQDLSDKIKAVLQDSPATELEKNLNALLQGTFSKLALVSRQEFDVQAECLRQTRAKLEALEAQLAQLEKQQAAQLEKQQSSS